MSEYDFVFETPYNIPKGTAYPCTIDRPKDQRKQVLVSLFNYQTIFNLLVTHANKNHATRN